jgi:hypothetical protein
VTLEHLRRLAPLALRHRLRRNPLDDAVATTRVARAVTEVFGPGTPLPVIVEWVGAHVPDHGA